MKECRRLIRKCYPDCTATVHVNKPMCAYALVTAMSWGLHDTDYSCEACPRETRSASDKDLASQGGVWDNDDSTIYQRLLDRAGFSPTGRAVILPDDYCTFGRAPIVCDSRTASERVFEFSDKNAGDAQCSVLFDNISDIVFVYESGEAMVLDHDQRFFWGKSASLRVVAGSLTTESLT